MKRIQDKTGWVTASLCCLALFIHYGLRDALLTALPIIAKTDVNFSKSISGNDVIIVHRQVVNIEYDISTISVLDNNNYTTPLYQSTSYLYNLEDYPTTTVHPNIEGWDDNTTTINEATTAITTTSITEKEEELTTRDYNLSDDISVITESSVLTTDYTEPQVSTSPRILEDNQAWRTDTGSQSDLSLTTPTVSDNLANSGNELNKTSNHQAPLTFLKKLLNKLSGGDDVISTKSTKEVSQKFMLKEEWSGVLVGLALAAFPFGSFLTLLPGHVMMPKVDPRIILSISLAGSSFVGFFIELAVSGGPWGVISLRLVQGLFQGVVFPAVYSLLATTPITSRVFIAALVYSGPYIGTASGAGLSLVPSWSVSFYLFSSLGIIAAVLPVFLNVEQFNPRGKLWWKSVISPAVIACMGVQGASIWVLHTCLIGLGFCLVYQQNHTAKLWSVVLLPIFGLMYQVILPISRTFTNRIAVSALNRRRAPVIAGSVVSVTFMIVASTAGVQSPDVLIAMTVLGAGVGSTLCSGSVMKNLHDLSYHRYPSLVLAINIMSTITSCVASFCVPTCAFAFQDDDDDPTTTEDGWLLVWLLPLTLLVPAMVAYLFLVSTKRITSDVDFPAAGLPPISSAAPPPPGGLKDPGPLEMRSVKSFKSLQSSKTAMTFKTAMSKARSRTQSFQTVNDTVDGDIYTIPDDMSAEMHSVQRDTQDDVKSIASGSGSFKSDGADMRSVVDDPVGTAQEHRFSEMLSSTNNTDRTSAWLEVHHSVNINRPSISNNNLDNLNKNDFRIINSIYTLLW